MKKRIVRQVGYLQELNRDARSSKHKRFRKKTYECCEEKRVAYIFRVLTFFAS